jgi:hypothetical protein
MVVADAIGWAGAVIVIATYAHIARAGLRSAHHVANAVGGAALAFGATAHGTWPSVAENVVWVALACYGLRPRRRRIEEPEDARPGTAAAPSGPAPTTLVDAHDLAAVALAPAPPGPGVSEYGRRYAQPSRETEPFAARRTRRGAQVGTPWPTSSAQPGS